MEQFVSWMSDAVDGISRNPFDPKLWGAVFAVLVLVSIGSIVRALNRLARQLSSASEELSEIRSILRKLDRSLESGKPGAPAGDQGEKDILNLPLR